MLHITGLKKAYGPVVALQGVDLSVTAGETVGLLGPNGAGKTTLVSIVVGLRHADAGSVYVKGIDALRYPEKVRPFLGLAPQDLGVYPPLTVHANLRFFGELAGLHGKLLRLRIDELAHALSLEELLTRKAGELSGGQKRRLHTAMALLGRPQLLFLDEPTVGADVETRIAILTVVKQLAADGCAVCYCTHYLGEVEQLGASIALLEDGQMVARGSLNALIAAYGTTQVQLTFAGDAPQRSGWITEGSHAVIPTDNPAATAAATLVTLGVDAARLRALEIIQPSLESVYLALTGHRFEALRSPSAEVPHVTDT